VCILFAISGGEFQSATEVIAALHSRYIGSQPTLLRTQQTTVAKFNQQIPAIAAVVNTWWTWVCHSLSAEQPSPTSNWLLTRLLPVVYWQQQLRKDPCPKAPTNLVTHAHRLYSQDSPHSHHQS